MAELGPNTLPTMVSVMSAGRGDSARPKSARSMRFNSTAWFLMARRVRKAALGCDGGPRGIETNRPGHWRIVRVPKDGNCGFSALAQGFNLLKGKTMTADEVRWALHNEISGNKDYYESRAKDNPIFEILLSETSPEDVAASVVRRNIGGHWLGEKWGVLEIEAVARALDVAVGLFTKEGIPGGRIRQYYCSEKRETFLGLLFSGSSAGGHFDLIVRADLRSA